MNNKSDKKDSRHGRGKNRFRRRRERPEFDQKMIDLARVTRVVKGGRRFSFRASVVAGNRKGRIGFGVAKGSDVSNAIGKAFEAAKKNMTNIKRTNSTISFEVRKKFRAAQVMIKPAREGRGIVAGGAMRVVLELAGIKDVVAKSFGSANKINVARATIAALEELSQAMVKEVNGKSEKSKKVEDKKVKTDIKKK